MILYSVLIDSTDTSDVYLYSYCPIFVFYRTLLRAGRVVVVVVCLFHAVETQEIGKWWFFLAYLPKVDIMGNYLM